MSADNTIGILATARRDGRKGLEYRVCHRQVIENIEYEADYPPRNPVLNREEVLYTWGKSQVFTKYEDAQRAAWKLEADAGHVEYGVVDFAYPDIFFPASDGKLRRRARYLQYLARRRQVA